MAYIENCNLFMVYFNENEKNELFQIWQNYKPEHQAIIQNSSKPAT